MTYRIPSESELPDDLQDRLSSTFDYETIRQLLVNTYYRGPIPGGDEESETLADQGHALASMPGSHRKSVLRKATEVGIVAETSEGYVTTERGAALLERMTDCAECGTEEQPGFLPVEDDSHRRYDTACRSCEEFYRPGPDGDVTPGEWHHFERDEDSLEAAVEAMQANPDVELWLNAMSLTYANNQI